MAGKEQLTRAYFSHLGLNSTNLTDSSTPNDTVGKARADLIGLGNLHLLLQHGNGHHRQHLVTRMGTAWGQVIFTSTDMCKTPTGHRARRQYPENHAPGLQCIPLTQLPNPCQYPTRMPTRPIQPFDAHAHGFSMFGVLMPTLQILQTQPPSCLASFGAFFLVLHQFSLLDLLDNHPAFRPKFHRTQQ